MPAWLVRILVRLDTFLDRRHAAKVYRPRHNGRQARAQPAPVRQAFVVPDESLERDTVDVWRNVG